MAKKPWFAPIFEGAELHVIKTRFRKDSYFYEIVRPNKKTIKWNPEIYEKIGCTIRVWPIFFLFTATLWILPCSAQLKRLWVQSSMKCLVKERKMTPTTPIWTFVSMFQ